MFGRDKQNNQGSDDAQAVPVAVATSDDNFQMPMPAPTDELNLPVPTPTPTPFDDVHAVTPGMPNNLAVPPSPMPTPAEPVMPVVDESMQTLENPQMPTENDMATSENETPDMAAEPMPNEHTENAEMPAAMEAVSEPEASPMNDEQPSSSESFDELANEPDEAAQEPEMPAESDMATSENETPDMAAEPMPDGDLVADSYEHNEHNHTEGANMDLNELKQDALRTLSPLLNHLDQSPEEKYNTALDIYKETNDQTMLGTIYEAAKNLPDEKAKANAIYDIIQKINSLNA